MRWRRRLGRAVVSQFHRPRGPVGWLVGWEMALRPSNRQRNRWAVSLLDVEPTDRFLEIGFGPGIAISEAARRATHGTVIGIDHSAEMVRQATRRNRAAVRAGTVVLRQMEADALPTLGSIFDKVLVVNSLGFWPHPVDRLSDIRSMMSEGGLLAIVAQPRCPGATSAHTEQAEQAIRRQVAHTGFTVIRAERLALDPPVVCVLATRGRRRRSERAVASCTPAP